MMRAAHYLWVYAAAVPCACQHGSCAAGTCVCDANWTGSDCSQSIAVNVRTPAVVRFPIHLVHDASLIASSFARPIGSPTLAVANATAAASTLLHNARGMLSSAAQSRMRNARLSAQKRIRAHQEQVVAPPTQSRVFPGTSCQCVRGKCVAGGCVCDSGWTGAACDTLRCKNDCSLRGMCVSSMCVCDSSSFGAYCQHIRCPEDCNGNGYCFQGTCQCAMGFGGPACSLLRPQRKMVNIKLEAAETKGRQPTAEDTLSLRVLPPKSCFNNCSKRGDCVDGYCNCFPGYSGTSCQHGCPSECSHQGTCIEGNCLCFAGFSDVDCSKKGCCNGHGTCDNPGECVCFEGWTGSVCDTVAMCPDPACGGHGTCASGTCHCDVGFEGPVCLASGECSPPCSIHGSCNPATKTCVCEAGYTGPQCAKGMAPCATFCSHRGLCLNGQCMCTTGWQGKDCSEPYAQPGSPLNTIPGSGVDVRLSAVTGMVCGQDGLCSGRGNCNTASGTCVCDDGWHGRECQLAMCPGSPECSGHGACDNTVGTCLCASGFVGETCAERSCAGSCGLHGSCRNGICACDQSWAGDQCDDPKCPQDCSGRGICSRGQCRCAKGFLGEDCSISLCAEACVCTDRTPEECSLCISKCERREPSRVRRADYALLAQHRARKHAEVSVETLPRHVEVYVETV